MNRFWNLSIYEIGANACDGRDQIAQLLLTGGGKFEGELRQGCGNVHEPPDKRYNTTHLCGVLWRIVRAAQGATQG